MSLHTKLVMLGLTVLVLAECIGGSFVTGQLQFVLLPITFLSSAVWGWFAVEAWRERKHRGLRLQRNLH